MSIIEYVGTLSRRDYRDWLAIPSANSEVHISGYFRQDYRYVWVLPLLLSARAALHIVWSDALVSLSHVLIAVIVASGLTLAEVFEEELIDYIPVRAHFFLWGCSRKYRHSRWFPPSLPPYVAACACACFDEPLASVVVTAHYLIRKHKAD